MNRGARRLLLVTALVAAGCSSDDDGAEPTVAPTVESTTLTTTVAPTTVAPPPTTPASTTAPPTTLPPPTTPPTTPPTSPPPDPLADLAATIERDLNLGEAILFEIGADPTAPDVRAKAVRYFVGRSLENVIAGIESLVADDLVLLPSPTTPNIIRLMTEPVVDETGDVPLATAETCRIDASELWARANEGDVMVPIETGSIRINSLTRFKLIDGIWKLDGGEVISREEGATTCE